MDKEIMTEQREDYMDYLIHNRMELTNQITRCLDEILLLQKKLDIAIRALKFYTNDICSEPYQASVRGY